MKKKYLNTIEDFEKFLASLEPEKLTKLYWEGPEEDSFDCYNYLNTTFNNRSVIIHDTVYGYISVLSDFMGIVKYDDYIEELWSEFDVEGGSKLYIEVEDEEN